MSENNDETKKISFTIPVGLIVFILIIVLFFSQVWPDRYNIIIDFENTTSFGECYLNCTDQMFKRRCFSAGLHRGYILIDNDKNYSCECVLHTCFKNIGTV